MKKLKKMLKKLKMSQTELAKRLGITRMAVNIAIKNGIKNIGTAKRYAAALGCTWQELIDED